MALSVWQRTIVTGAGDAIPAAEIEVFLAGTATAATLFQDAAGATPLTNPFNATAQGFAQFYVARGRYDIVASGAGSSITWSDVEIGSGFDVIWQSPYDYGAIPGQELTGNNKAAIDALMDAAKASWNSTYKTYTIMPTGLGKMWNCPGGTRMVGVRQKGMIIRDFQLYLSGSGAIGFDILGSAWVTFENCHVEGDFASEPAVGFLYGLDSSLDIASRISLFNCSTLGGFTKAGRVNIASETSLEVGCRWWNGSRSLTAVASAAVDHAGALDDHLGGVTSPNTTILQAAQGHRSFVLHDWGTTQHIRYSRVNLQVTALSKANPCVVTVATGTLAGSGLANGDTIFFYPMQGMTELRYGVFTVANISGDTFELSGVDSSLYSTFDPIPVSSGGAGHSARVRNQTGPAMLLAGPQELRNGPAYTVTYGAPHIIMDRNQLTGVNPSNTASKIHLALQCEPDPITVMDIYQGASTMTAQDWNLELLGSAHPPGEQVYDFKNAGNVLFHSGKTSITRMSSAPENGLFRGATVGPPPKTAGLVSLWMHDISVPLDAALTAPDQFALYRVREIAFDRVPDRLRDYEQPRFHDIPEFVQTTIPGVGARTRLDEASASAGPYFDLIRNSTSPAVSDFLGRYRIIGDNDASPEQEEVEYASIGGQILVATDGIESGRLVFFASTGGLLSNVGFADTNGLWSRGDIVQTRQIATQSDLRNITSAVNTTRKGPGKQVWDSTNGKPVFATGGAAGNVWNNADGTTAHTPV